METFLIKALQLIFSLSILVIVHEFGHFLFARIFKIRVEKFYLFFDPWFALFRHRPKNSETEYGIGWLPLGGYVKIAGMIDESMDKEQLKQPPRPWEFRSKPAWQRLLVMIAGVVFNLLLAFFIYAMIVFTWGDSYIALKNVPTGMEYSQTAKNIGFQDGDIIVLADGKEVIDRFDVVDNFGSQILDAKQITVVRDGQKKVITIPEDFVQQLLKDKKGFASYRFPTVVNQAIKGSEAAKIGLQKGDSLVAINGISTPFFPDFREALQNNKEKNITLDLYRNGQLQTLNAHVDENGTLGFSTKNYLTTHKYSFFSSFPAGFNLAVRTLKNYIAQFKIVFTKEGAKSLGGFGTMGKLFPSSWDWYAFWRMTAFLSVILAFMNILPIPALDGGHVMFLIYEVVSGRKPGDKFMEYAQVVGMVILFGLLIYANGMDLIRAIFK